MSRIVKIGGACGFYGDSSVAPKQLIDAGVDYLMLDYLAEATMSVLGQMRKKRDTLGYAMDFTEWAWKDNLKALKETGTKVVTNAGGVNPHACAARLKEIADEAGLKFNIAVVTGDEMIGRIGEFSDDTELFTGKAFPPKDKIFTANAYLGATPIARALAMGADVVLTGRAVDTALALGPLIHEFGWGADDYDRLSAGSLAGHILECGAQGSGALFTDWEEVEDWAHIGYPIAECAADGSFVVTKPKGTGGLVSVGVVAEQAVYEIGDPQAYMLPDVVCDWSGIQLKQVGEHRVNVSGAKGYAPTGKYKVSITWADGFRCMGFMPIVGRDAAKKAQRQADAVLSRVEEMLRDRNLPPFREKRVEVLGAETSYGANANPAAQATREVVYKIGVEHDDKAAFKLFLREFDAPTTSMAVGTTGWFGSRAQITTVMRVFSTTVERESAEVTIAMNETEEKLIVAPLAKRFSHDMITRPKKPVALSFDNLEHTVPLVELAWARSGDKGDAFNVGVIARRPEWLPYISAALSQDAVRKWFDHEFEDGANPDVKRYDLPGLNAINLHCLDALGGGQFATMRLDPLAKGKAQQLLDFPVPVPVDLLGKTAAKA